MCMDDFIDLRGNTSENIDKELDSKLRPLRFADFSGQNKIVENLKIFVQAAVMRGESLDHVLLHGPPGLGKTTLAHIIANEMGGRLHQAPGPTLEKSADLLSILSELKEGDEVTSTGELLSLPVGPEFLGRVIDPLGNPAI